MPTYIDGIASSQAIDTAGEIVDINGLDCSSLVGAAFNWEHKADLPAQIVGKILKYKKIFSEEDCETDRQLMYWNKLKMPYLYVMGRLFDDKKDSAKEVAALFMDDAEHPDEQPMVGFSIEGSKIDKNSMTITKSIARKVTITAIPANKTCVAEMVPSKEPALSDDIDDIFKTEPFTEIELFKSEPKPVKKTDLFSSSGPSSPNGILENSEIKKAQVPGSKYPTAAEAALKPKIPGVGKPQFASVGPSGKDPGSHIGTTASGIKIHSHMPVGDYGRMSSGEHKEAAGFHTKAAQSAPSADLRGHHSDKAKLHEQAALTSTKREGRFQSGLAGKQQAAREHAKKDLGKAEKMKKVADVSMSGNAAPAMMGKSMTAGSGMAAPSALEGGPALASESLDGKMKKIGKKSKWLARAEEEYERWDKKEEFRKFMQEKLPSLTRGEIDAIGKTLALGKSLKMEKAISRLNSAYKDGAHQGSYIPNYQKKEMQKFDDGVLDAPMANKEKVSSVPAQIPAPCLTMSEKKGNNLKKGTDVMIASERKKK